MKDGAIRGSRGFRDFPKRPHTNEITTEPSSAQTSPLPLTVPPDGESLRIGRALSLASLLMCQGAHFQTGRPGLRTERSSGITSFRSHTCTCYIKALKPELEYNLPKQADS